MVRSVSSCTLTHPAGGLWGGSSSGYRLRPAGGVGAAVELGSAAAGGGGGGPSGPAARCEPLCWSSFGVWHPAEPGVTAQLHPAESSLHHVQVWQRRTCAPRLFSLNISFSHSCSSSLPLSVDFSKPVSSAFRSHSSQFVAQSGGRAQVVLSWWDLDMDPSGSIVCTMAPSWTYPQPKMAPVSYRTVLCWSVLGSHQPLLMSVVCFSGGTTGCRVSTSCLWRGRLQKERSWVWLSATMTTVCGTACGLTGNRSETVYSILTWTSTLSSNLQEQEHQLLTNQSHHMLHLVAVWRF